MKKLDLKSRIKKEKVKETDKPLTMRNLIFYAVVAWVFFCVIATAYHQIAGR